MTDSPKPVCVVAGAGPGNGTAIAHRFDDAGYAVALLARNPATLSALSRAIPRALCLSCDVTVGDQVSMAFDEIRARLGGISVLVYNAGAGVFGNIDDITAAQLENAWRTNTLGLYLCTRAILPDMRTAGSGNIIVIGATASKRGGANFAAFASAKAAQYNLAQSMARHLGPERIHVGYVIIDGVVDLERTRKRLPDKPDEFFLQSPDIAESVYQLTRQKSSAWTFELDLRPFAEKW